MSYSEYNIGREHGFDKATNLVLMKLLEKAIAEESRGLLAAGSVWREAIKLVEEIDEAGVDAKGTTKAERRSLDGESWTRTYFRIETDYWIDHAFDSEKEALNKAAAHELVLRIEEKATVVERAVAKADGDR